MGSDISPRSAALQNHRHHPDPLPHDAKLLPVTDPVEVPRLFHIDNQEGIAHGYGPAQRLCEIRQRLVSRPLALRLS